MEKRKEESLSDSLMASLEELRVGAVNGTLKRVSLDEIKRKNRERYLKKAVGEVYTVVRKRKDDEGYYYSIEKEVKKSSSVEISEMVKKIRSIMKVNQEEFASILRVSSGLVRQWEQKNKIGKTDEILMKLLYKHPELILEID